MQYLKVIQKDIIIEHTTMENKTKSKRGRKPKEHIEKRSVVPVMLSNSLIEKHGGLSGMKKAIREKFEG